MLQELVMNFIHGLMLSQSKLSHQQHEVESKGKSWQGERIGGRTAVQSLMAWTTGIRTAIGTVDDSDDLLERDDGSLRDAGTAA